MAALRLTVRKWRSEEVLRVIRVKVAWPVIVTALCTERPGWKGKDEGRERKKGREGGGRRKKEEGGVW